jgi:hypothetical protein
MPWHSIHDETTVTDVLKITLFLILVLLGLVGTIAFLSSGDSIQDETSVTDVLKIAVLLISALTGLVGAIVSPSS